jgi:cellulose synthase operon protein C
MRALPVLLLVTSCASSFPKLDLTTLPKKSDYPDAKYVVLLDEDHVRFQPGKDGKAEAIVTERTRYKLLKPSDLPTFTVWYQTEFSEVISMSGRTVLPDGTEAPLDLEKAWDRPSFDSSVLFSATRLKSVPTPPLPVGAIYETVAVTRRKDVEPWVLKHSFGSVEPVVESRVIVEAPSAWKLRWVARDFETVVDLQPVKEEPLDGAFTRRTFERKDIKALPVDPGAPSLWWRHLRMGLRLDAWAENGVEKKAPDSPRALSALGWQQHQDRSELTPELRAAAQEVLAGVPDEPEAKARALYEYVCRRVQYCAIEIGYGGWIPHAAKDVHANRWGDCKDKATYLHTLLKVAGIESSPTSIYAHDGYPRPFELPSLGDNFNHEILAIHLPSGTVYADPTTRAVPFGQLPWNDAEATVLQATQKGTELAVTPPTRPEESVELHRYDLVLDALGRGRGTFRIEATGNNATTYKGRAIFGSGRLEKWARDAIWLKNADVPATRFESAADFGQATVLVGEILAPEIVTRGLGQTALLRVSDMLSPVVPTLHAERKTPFAFRWLATTDAEVAVTIPETITVEAPPATTRLESPFGRYELSWRTEGRALIVKRRFVRNVRTIPVDSLEKARTFFDEISAAELMPVVLRFGGSR